MRLKLIQGIVHKDENGVKKGDTIWLIAGQVKDGTHFCKYLDGQVFYDKKEAEEALYKFRKYPEDRFSVTSDCKNPNKVEWIEIR